MMEPPNVVDDSFRNLFNRVAEVIHDREDFEKAHGTLVNHFKHIGNGNSRAVYQVPSDIAGEDTPLVVKFALPATGKSGSEDALYPIEYTEGWMSNWHEIILSRFEPLNELLVPVVDHHEDGLWIVMPYAQTLSRSQEVADKLGPLTDMIEQADVEFASHGVTTGQPEIYQINAWGLYQDEYRLRDYGGIVVSDEEFLRNLPYPLSEPNI